jgi:hypothetical protein
MGTMSWWSRSKVHFYPVAKVVWLERSRIGLPLQYLNRHIEQSLHFLEIVQWTIVTRVHQPAVCLLRRTEVILYLRDRPSDVGK